MSGAGIGLVASNAYLGQISNDFIYANDHASLGACGIAFNYPSLWKVSIFTGSGATTAGQSFAPTPRMTIDQVGNVGIGTASPTSKLHFVGELGIDSPGWSWDSWQIYQNASDGTDDYGLTFKRGPDIWFTIGNIPFNAVSFPIGNVGIGTTSPGYKLTVNGEPAANGYTQFTNYSDIRLKENSTPIGNALSSILALNPVSFYYSEKAGYANAADKSFSGFVAQELLEYFPDMVGTTEINGIEYYDSNLSSLPIYIVKAMQQQQDYIERLQSQNDELLVRIEALEAKFE